MPKVTVVIPNYNHARFLEKRINSVLNQTYQDFEILYLDDASTDNSEAVFAQFSGHPKIRVYLNEVNSGSTFHQWNKGVREAKGEYIWFAEADDYADESLLQTLVASLDDHPNVGLAYCSSYIVDQEDVIQSTTLGWTDDLDKDHWKDDFISDGREECRLHLSRHNIIPNASAVLFRKSVYQKVGGADEKTRVCGDWMLWAKVLIASDIAYRATPLNYFRTHNQTVRSKSLMNGLQAEESYMVLSHIHKTLVLDKATLRLACERMRIDWLNVALSHVGPSQIPWKRNWRIYRLAKELDPCLRSRLRRHLLAFMLRRMGIDPRRLISWGRVVFGLRKKA